jgi:hypothetical protein
MSESHVRSVLVVGVSGATWTVLRPLLESGRAPNIARLLERGCGGVLKSVLAPDDKHYRPQVAWPSIATGRRPEGHGVTRFFHEADELRAPTLWDIFERQGLAVGVYGWPGVWPPKPANGFIVPSHLARDARTWPPELGVIKAIDREQQAVERGGAGPAARLLSAVGVLGAYLRHGLRLRTILGSVSPSLFFGALEQRRLLLRRVKFEASIDLFVRLLGRFQPRFSAFVSFYPDFVSHRYWRYREPDRFEDTPQGSPYASAVDDAYIALDRAVGRLAAHAGKDAIIALVSEHGMAAEPVSTELGPWYYGLRGDRIRQLMGLGPETGPHPVARWLAFRPIAPDAVTAVADAFRRIVVVETGLPLFQVYEHGEEVVIKLALYRDTPRYLEGDLGDLTIRIGERVAAFTDIAQRFGRRRSAMHAADGVLILAGPGIRRGHWLEGATVMDVAPTLLRAAGLAADTPFDGRVLDVFAVEAAALPAA